MFKKFVEDKCIFYENSQLEKKYPAFKSLMQEYHDGILLFELTNDLIWEKAIKDTVGLKNFYEKNKLNYLWGERANTSIYTVNNPDMVKKARRYARKGKSIKEINSYFNNDSTINVSVVEKIYSKDEDDIIKGCKWEKGLNDNIIKDGVTTFVMINNIIPPEPKSLNEAKGLITADYQNYLEKEWIKQLRKKYSYTVNKDVLKSIIK